MYHSLFVHRCRYLCGNKFSAPLYHYREAHLLDHMVRVCLDLRKATKLSSKVAFCIFIGKEWNCLLLAVRPRQCLALSIPNSARSETCVAVPHSCLNLLTEQLRGTSFHVLIDICISSLVRFVQVFDQFLNWAVCFHFVEFHECYCFLVQSEEAGNPGKGVAFL